MFQKLTPLQKKFRAQLLLSCWLDTRHLTNLPDTILKQARQYMFFDKRIPTRFNHLDEPQKSDDFVEELDDPSAGLTCTIKRPKFLDELSVYFQKYADRIVDNLYKNSSDILGERPEFIFRVVSTKKEKTPAEISPKTYPFQITFSIQELAKYSLIDELAFVLSHELIHLSIATDILLTQTKQEEAVADLLGTLIMTRAGYHPAGSIICQGNWCPAVDSFLEKINDKNIPLNPQTLGDIKAIYEMSQIGLLNKPFSITKETKERLDTHQVQHPFSGVRAAYLIEFSKYLKTQNLLPKDCMPLDKKLMDLIDSRLQKKPSFYKKHPLPQVLHKIARHNKAFAKQIASE